MLVLLKAPMLEITTSYNSKITVGIVEGNNTLTCPAWNKARVYKSIVFQEHKTSNYGQTVHRLPP